MKKLTLFILSFGCAIATKSFAAKKPPAKPPTKSPKASSTTPSPKSKSKSDPVSDFGSDPSPKSTTEKSNEVKSTRHETATASSQTKRFGVGLEFGSNATYGNGLVTHFDLFRYLDLQFGVGYNTTGIKMGAGSAFILPIGSSFGFDVGGAFVHSNGTTGKVSLDAKFAPSGTNSEENVKATKQFKTTPANYISVMGGLFFDIAPMFRVLAHANFNKVLSGNEVQLDDKTEYDQTIDVTNETDVESDFETKAKSKLDIAGLGFSAGVQFRF